MNLYPHFRLLRRAASRPAWALELSVNDERRMWDVPRGAPRPRERHLAIERSQNADVPNLGECWDAGPCEVRKWTPRHVVVVLHGAKLKGCFSLVRFRPLTNPHWLWVRVRPDHHTQRPVSPAPVAVSSGVFS